MSIVGEWLSNILWALKRWYATYRCKAHHRHVLELQGVHQVEGSVVEWCRVCSHVEWVD